MMQKFRKRPMTVEGFRLDLNQSVPDCVKFDVKTGKYYVQGDGIHQPPNMVVKEGDWVVRGESGQWYGCPEAEFLRVYEPIPQ